MAASGYRGTILARKRAERGVGQNHLARALGMTAPELSRFEREAYGGLPRGMSSRYMAALDALYSACGSECYDGCGCAKCPGCGNVRRADMRYCGGGACARLVVTVGIEGARP